MRSFYEDVKSVPSGLFIDAWLSRAGTRGSLSEDWTVAPFLKVLQKLRYRSEHVVQVPVEYYSQLDRAPSPRKQDRGFGGELSGRVHGYALTLGFGRHGVEAGALRVPYWLTVFRDTKAPGEQHGEAVSPTEPRSKACSAA